MQAEIITIGDEILIGQVIDTNSAWLGQHLNETGIKITRITSIMDDRAEITKAVDDALGRSGLVIVTGGLGPTKDDITKITLAGYFGCGMARHQPTYDHIEKMTAERGFDFNELNKGQAMVPECCDVILNYNGTAPGMWFEKDGRVLISMPGVPFEMEAIMTDSVMPRLRERFNLKSIVHKTAITYGIAESALALEIAGWEDSLPDYIKLAYLPNPNGIRLRLSAYETDHDAAEAEIDARFTELEKIIPEYFIGYGDTTLVGFVAGMLASRGETLSVAESCTGGALASVFTSMPGASEYFLGGVVSYSNDVKADALGVNRRDLDEYGAVSRQVAEQMAEGVRRMTGSTYGLATTGVAGPSGGTPEKPVGTVWLAVATPHGTFSELAHLGRLRGEIVKRAVANVVNMLRVAINQNP